MAHLTLDLKKIARCREIAENIARPISELINRHTTIAIERTALRLIGVNGAVKRSGQWYPEVNAIADDLHTELLAKMTPAERANPPLSRGILYYFVNGMIQKKMAPSELGRAVAEWKVNLLKLPFAPDAEIEKDRKSVV